MFKKFSHEEISLQNQVKSSVQRGIRSTIVEQFPAIEPYIEEILPKKQLMILAKCHNHINLIATNDEIVFFNVRDGPYYPTLRLLHKYPILLPKLQVDRGAIKFVMSGAHIMCPGLTSPGARMDVDVPAETIVQIMAEGKEHTLAVGVTKMSTQEIRTINKGIGVENVHYLNDGLWKIPKLSQ